MSKLDNIADFLLNPQPWLEEIGKEQVQIHLDRAQREVDPDGVRWHRLDPAYASRKSGPSILQATTTMIGSFDYELDPGNFTVKIGPRLDHIRVGAHQQDGDRTSTLDIGLGKKLKARPFVGMPTGEVGELTDNLLNSLVDAANA